MALVMLSACSAMGNNSAINLDKSNWELTHWENHDIPHGDNGEPIKLWFVDNKLSGFSGCNRYFGGYKLAGDQFTAVNMGSTKMACLSETRNALEQKFLATLQAGGTITQSKNRLTITTAQDAPLEFSLRAE